MYIKIDEQLKITFDFFGDPERLARLKNPERTVVWDKKSSAHDR